MLFLLVLVFPIFREVGKKKDIHHLKCFLIIGPEGGVRGLRTPQQLIWSSAWRCGKGQLILGWTFPGKLFFFFVIFLSLLWHGLWKPFQMVGQIYIRFHLIYIWTKSPHSGNCRPKLSCKRKRWQQQCNAWGCSDQVMLRDVRAWRERRKWRL